MTYRESSNTPESRSKELLGEIEIVDQRARELPYLVWKKKELVQQLEVVTGGRYKAPRSAREKLVASLRYAVGVAVTIMFVVMIFLVSLAAAAKYIGPRPSRPGSSGGYDLHPWD